MATSDVIRPSPEQEQKLMSMIWDPRIADDPLAFVMMVFPWGQKGTPLEKFKEPRTWQKEELRSIAAHIKEQRKRVANGKDPEIYKSATVSGRGSGKSALVAWLILWMMSTRLGSSTIVAANSEDQLKSKTWAELGKWHTLAINSHWFAKNTMALKPDPWFEEALKRQMKLDTGYYYANAQLWTEEKPDSFAGAHNWNGLLLIFDEASGIPSVIWDVAEGFFTEKTINRFHMVFSNGRKNTGMFYECFHRFRKFWRRRHLDSRTVEGIDVKPLEEIIEKYGEDSDQARVEVKGQFPRQGDKQFISRDKVEAAVNRDVPLDRHAPLIMGVDIARYGDDSTIIAFRQGRNAKVIPWIELAQRDNMDVANEIAHLIHRYNPDAVAIDVGNGSGVIDRLREMGFKIHEVSFGKSSPDPEYANMRTWMWAEIREWLPGGCIPDDPDLCDDLTGPEYRFFRGGDSIMLETKEQMKSRGHASPDRGDALACTFAVKVARKDINASRANQKQKTQARNVNYNIFG